MAKRANGEGTRYFDQASGRWIAQIYVRTPDGARRRKTLRADSEREVLRLVREVQRRNDAGLATTTGRGQTVSEYGTRWIHELLPAQVRLGQISPRTADTYSTLWLTHVAPGLGHHYLAHLTPAQVRTWLASKVGAKSATGKPLSGRSVAAVHSVLRRALGDALREELVSRNVATLVAPPRYEAKQVDALTSDEAAKVLKAAPAHDLGALWILLLAMGLRLGEALALRWKDLDFDNASLTVERSVGRVRSAPDDEGKRETSLVVGRTKTTGSRATLPMPKVVVDVLREHRAAQSRRRMAAPSWTDSKLVFTTCSGGLLDSRNVLRAWKSFAKNAGIARDTRVHLLRHSTATFLLEQGVPMEVIKTLLRHTRLATTSDLYAHVTEVLQRDAATAMDRFMGGLGEAK